MTQPINKEIERKQVILTHEDAIVAIKKKGINGILNSIINADCLDFMKEMPDKCVDLAFCDPDYNAKDIGPNKRTYKDGMPNLPLNEYKKFIRDWTQEVFRIAKNVLITPGIANDNYYPQPFWKICWHKPAAVSFNRMGGFNAWEPILVYGKTAKGKRLGQDYILENTLNFSKGPEVGHPCPKPLNLIKKLLDTFSNEGEIIFDPFLGSGTTAIAAKMLGRNYIGIEIEPKYVKIAEARIKACPTPLFV